jgi:hypothetical protein
MATTKRLPNQNQSTLPHAKHTKQNSSAFQGGRYAERHSTATIPTEIQCQSYKHNYARPNNNCEIAGIARGQKAMSGGMETIPPSYAGGSRILGRHRSRERDKNDHIWTWRTAWNSKLVKAVFLSSICFTMQMLKQVCLPACSQCVVRLHNVPPALQSPIHTCNMHGSYTHTYIHTYIHTCMCIIIT